MPRTEGVTQPLLDKRLNYTMKLRFKGYSQQQILNEINKKAETEGWGTIGLRQLKRMFVEYHKQNMLRGAGEEREVMKAMRDQHLQELENMIAEYHQEVRTKTDWKPFEKQRTIKMLFDMKARYASLKGWDYSIIRKSEDEILKEEEQTSMNRKFDEASVDLMNTPPEAIKRYIESMEPLKKVLKEKRIKDRAAEPHVLIIDKKTEKHIDPETL